jgi:hypothetical protein
MRPHRRLSGLAPQIDRSGPRIEKAALAFLSAPAFVDDSAQTLKQLRHAANLVQDNEPVREVLKEQHPPDWRDSCGRPDPRGRTRSLSENSDRSEANQVRPQ